MIWLRLWVFAMHQGLWRDPVGAADTLWKSMRIAFALRKNALGCARNNAPAFRRGESGFVRSRSSRAILAQNSGILRRQLPAFRRIGLVRTHEGQSPTTAHTMARFSGTQQVNVTPIIGPTSKRVEFQANKRRTQ